MLGPVRAVVSDVLTVVLVVPVAQEDVVALVAVPVEGDVIQAAMMPVLVVLVVVLALEVVKAPAIRRELLDVQDVQAAVKAVAAVGIAPVIAQVVVRAVAQTVLEVVLAARARVLAAAPKQVVQVGAMAYAALTAQGVPGAKDVAVVVQVDVRGVPGVVLAAVVLDFVLERVRENVQALVPPLVKIVVHPMEAVQVLVAAAVVAVLVLAAEAAVGVVKVVRLNAILDAVQAAALLVIQLAIPPARCNVLQAVRDRYILLL